ncbi:MAG: VWA domain-containing protein, partial [Deltaproteobacteria bacterium]|nr:VWA domain-containing protein [Nannocystaceae bacterium]
GDEPSEPACDPEAPVTLFLSPDDSNSMSSPVQVRDAVLGGWSSVSAVPIRVWEFLNYYSFAYPAAEPGTVVVTPSLARDDDDPAGEYVLQIGVSSESSGIGVRPAINLVLVLDTSGSMEGHAMDMLKASCRVIAANLRADDIISLVTWNTENTEVLAGHTVNGPDDATLLAAIDGLAAGGGTDLYSGLQAGYALADEVYDSARINRLVLVSDGGANVGVTEIDLIAEQANRSGGDGIYMVGVGVGTADSYEDELMNDVTDAGKGASVFIDSDEEAERIFGERFVSTLSVAVRDVQVKLELPPGFEIVKFSGEEYSGDPAEIEPQHLAPDDAMVFHQQISTCAPQLVTDDTPITVTARFERVLGGEAEEVVVSTTFGELLAGDATQLRKGAAVFAYAEGLQAWKATIDREERDAIVGDIIAELERAETALPGDVDLAEIRRVLLAM